MVLILYVCDSPEDLRGSKKRATETLWIPEGPINVTLTDSSKNCSSAPAAGFWTKADSSPAASSQQPATRPKTWADLKALVHDFRRQMLSLSCLFPMNIKLRTLAGGRVLPVTVFLSAIPPWFGWTLDRTRSATRCILSVCSWTCCWSTPTTWDRATRSHGKCSCCSRGSGCQYGDHVVWDMHKASGNIVPVTCTGFNATPLFPSVLRIYQLLLNLPADLSKEFRPGWLCVGATFG